VKIDDLKALIRDVPDFPKPGIVFKDITPLLACPGAMQATAKYMADAIADAGAEELVGIDSRGFLFGAAIAAATAMPLQIVRKPGKLPYEKVGLDYDLEYGKDRVEIHTDAIVRGRRYAIVDDLLATGGTALATKTLVEEQGGIVVVSSFVIELGFLEGREKLAGSTVHSLLHY